MKIVVTHDPDFNNLNDYEANSVNSYHNLVTTSIASALIQLGHDVEICEANLELEKELIRIKPEFIFNTSIRNFNGSDYAFAPEILEKLEIPFTGPLAAACSYAYDKQKSIEILRKTGLHTPQAVTFAQLDEIKLPGNFSYPLFVKPRRGGCSQGISSQSLIATKAEAVNKIGAALETIGQPVIVEEFLPGREFTVGILGNHPPKVLSILEFIFHKGKLPFRSYSRKMIDYENEDEICLAQLEDTDRRAIENLALQAYNALECRDYARIDIRFDTNGNPAVLEVNALPNLEPNSSSFALMAAKTGLSFTKLIERIVESALNRYAIIN